MSVIADALLYNFQIAVAGRYSIDREIGRGGMGIVYLARDLHLDRWVAIKLLPPDLATRPGVRERFVREAQLAASLSHPHIVPIHAVEHSGTHVYFVMTYVEGETLTQRVRSRGPLSTTEGTRVLREVAWALSAAHARGVVHRDVKPDNILLETQTGRALVLDFGIAAASGDADDGPRCGTPAFMSPEHAMGRDVDARSDIYALGVTAFYALSGRLPFEGHTHHQVLAKQMTETAPSLGSMRVGVPRRLVQLVDACLSREPDHRPASAQQVADELEATLEQRRELPIALRAFVKRDSRMDGAGTLFTLATAFAGGVAVSSVAGQTAGLLTMGGVLAVSALSFGTATARRLLRMGFAHADLAPAFRSESLNSREERGATLAASPPWAERAARAITRIMLSTSGVLMTASLWAPQDARAVANMGFALLLLASAPALVALLMMQRRRDVDVEFWGRLWTGRAGEWMFGVARRWVGTTRPAIAMTHRATELALGMAAEDLYASLPEDVRDSLGNIPDLLRRFQHDAQRLRAHLQLYPYAMSDERESVQRQLQQVVSAIETIRLDLLRLHAGGISVQSLTTQLELVAEASADVNRLLQARDDVQSLLQFPRPIAITPV